MTTKKEALGKLKDNIGILFVAAFILGVLTGCAHVGPDYIPPEPTTQDVWHQKLVDGLAEGKADLKTWWTVFDDPVLTSLIDRATTGNLDLKEAFARLKEARARRGVATGERYPDVNGKGSVSRQRVTEDYLTIITDQDRNYNSGNVGLDATWEIDFWGRISRSIESADAGLQASLENYRDVLVLLYAEVTLNYVQVRTLQARIGFAEASVKTQRRTLEITRARLKAEISGELDVRQAELNLANTESIIPQLKSALVQTINRLGVFLGELPKALHQELSDPVPIPKPPDRILVGLPADLLRQRPDIRRAERQLAAQTARIGVAKADLYPRFSLSGAFAFEGTSDIFDSSKRSWFIAPAFRWNLFDGGRVRNRIKAEDTRTEQALVRYEQTVLAALEDMENTMTAYVQEGDRRETLHRAAIAADESVNLVKSLYKSGLTDFQNVFDMERSAFAQRQALAESQGLVTQNLIRIYRAMGGGWEPQPATLEKEIEDQQIHGEPVF
ncbi:MAG: efflux transporter outer membrane subunit [Desulfobacterales bacterium]